MNHITLRYALLVGLLVTCAAARQYSSVSGDYKSSRHFRSDITPSNVGLLTLKWARNLTSMAVQPPMIDRDLDAIYTCDTAGWVYAFAQSNGTLLW